MKTTILKHRFLYLFIIFGLTISYTSCKEDEEEPIPITFLEKYDGTIWESGGYLRINNDTNNPYNIWVYNSFDGCHQLIHSNEYFGDVSIVEVIENSNDKLIIEQTNNEGSTATVTLTGQGEILKFLSEDYDGEIEVSYFDKTSVNVDDFVICD